MNNHQALQALGLSESAAAEEIEQRFHDLMNRYAPESASVSLRPEYEAKQRELETAYKALTKVLPSSPPPALESSSSQIISKISSQVPLDRIKNVVPEATREEIMRGAKGVLDWERKRSNAKLDRIFQEVNVLMPQSAESGTTAQSPLRLKIIDEVGRHVGEALKQHDRLLMLILVTFPALPLCGAVIAKIPGLSFVATMLYLASVATFCLSFKCYSDMSKYVKSLRGIFTKMIQPFVFGNLNVAKSTNDLSRIQELISVPRPPEGMRLVGE